MRIAPLVSLPQNNLRYRLAYLMSDLVNYIFGPPTCMGELVQQTPRPAMMSCWRLGYKIVANLTVAFLVLGLLVGFLAVGGTLMAVMLWNSAEIRWMFVAIFASTITMGLWERFRVNKRLHILKRRICPLYRIV